MYILTIDIGGTEIKSAIYDKNGDVVANFDNFPSAVSETDNQISEQILSLCEQAISNYSIKGVAISTAGGVDPELGKIVFSGPNIPNYLGTNFSADIKNTFNLPCCVENDVNAMAIGEAWLGGAQNTQSALCITLGTGLGGAILIDGKVWHGSNCIAGEIGHIPLENGKRLEEEASTTALLAHYETISGEKIDGKELFIRLRSGDIHAEHALSLTIDALAHGLTGAICLFAPETILIGGGIAAQHDIIEPRLKQALLNKLPDGYFMPKTIRCAELGNRAGMIGALRCFLDKYE